jgi:hypothetical protein
VRQRVLTDTDEPRARHWRFLTDLEDVFVNPAHADVRFGQDHNDVEPPLGFGIPEFRFQPDGTGGTISIRVGATGMPATALCDQRAEPLVVPQANRASNVGCSVCGDPDGETEGRAEGRELHLVRPRHPEFQEAPEPGPSGRCEVPSCSACAAAGTRRTAPARSVSARRRVTVARSRVRGCLSSS